MEIKYHKPRYLLALIPFGTLLLFGIYSLWFYYDKYSVSTNISIIFGLFGSIFGLLMLLYRLFYIYEAKFENNGINVMKGKIKIFIDFNSIANIDYQKPSLFNYLTSTAGSSSYLFPGFLRINIKINNSKSKAYFIRLKYKDFERLPKNYKDLMKYPV
jgi:hypothetical protein